MELISCVKLKLNHLSSRAPHLPKLLLWRKVVDAEVLPMAQDLLSLCDYKQRRLGCYSDATAAAAETDRRRCNGAKQLFIDAPRTSMPRKKSALHSLK